MIISHQINVGVPMRTIYLICLALLLGGCKKDRVGTLTLLRASVGDTELGLDGTLKEGLAIDRSITLAFSGPVDQSTAEGSILLTANHQPVPIGLGFIAGGSTIVIHPSGLLTSNMVYTLEISDKLLGVGGARAQVYKMAFKTVMDDLRVEAIEIDGEPVNKNPLTEVPLNLGITVRFSGPLNEQTFQNAVTLQGQQGVTNLQVSLGEDKKSLSLASNVALKDLTKYELRISDLLRGAGGEGFSEITKTLYTTTDPNPKFPVIPKEELLTLVQRQTFKYFWDFAHPTSGMARERNSSGDVVTSGGSGFGIMTLIVGIERGFISRNEGVQRMEKIVGFLETADRFHGAWPHWINGNTGKTIAFSTNDNGGDLVETSLLAQGILTFRQYLNPSIAAEKTLATRINALWESIEWDWYRRENQNVLYWHWSPDKEWAMNLPIQGWNESLITYLLAASAPHHAITKEVYVKGWARNGAMKNGNVFEGVTLPLGIDNGGPLFFSQYSFLGLDPRNLTDQYADYWNQNLNHTLINHQYCIRNPLGYVGYSEDCWGLTASDDHNGYSAHSPTNDLGVITPSAALSAFPYTPAESMKALEFFYYKMGDRLWGTYGFYDAFNLSQQWFADSYLAIDQGPIIIMIENYRTGLLWNLFMSAPEVKNGLQKLGFNSPQL